MSKPQSSTSVIPLKESDKKNLKAGWKKTSRSYRLLSSNAEDYEVASPDRPMKHIVI
jgi:hypothetical protein